MRREEKTNLFALGPVLDVQLEQRLDVVAREGDRDHHDVVVAVLRETLDGIDGLRTLPGFRSDLRLPGEAIPEGNEGVSGGRQVDEANGERTGSCFQGEP